MNTDIKIDPMDCAIYAPIDTGSDRPTKATGTIELTDDRYRLGRTQTGLATLQKQQ